MSPLPLALAVALDLLLGDPRRLPHPIRWIGRFVNFLERLLYPRRAGAVAQRLAGTLLCILTLTATAGAGWAFLEACKAFSPVAFTVCQVILASYCLSTRSLAMESGAVLEHLRARDLPAARRALAMIVGRDTDNLDEQEIARATVETVAENITDGIVSPLCYLALGGPVASLAFKAASTMDSMIGYRNEHYRYFGAFAARLDDVLNYVPARITGFILLPLSSLVVGAGGMQALRVVRADRLRHPSPNAAHGEAAVAGALGIQLGGTATYGGKHSCKPILNAGGRHARAADIYRTICMAYAAALLCAAFAVGARLLLEGGIG
jgi:adenosylcobinamide-phosphate synthase